jgi:hypothetical protein
LVFQDGSEKKDEAEKKEKTEPEQKEKKKKCTEKKVKEVVPPPPAVHKKDFEKDVVYLYQFNRTTSIPSMSRYCLKVETWLKLNGIKYEVRDVSPHSVVQTGTPQTCPLRKESAFRRLGVSFSV